MHLADTFSDELGLPSCHKVFDDMIRHKRNVTFGHLKGGPIWQAQRRAVDQSMYKDRFRLVGRSDHCWYERDIIVQISLRLRQSLEHAIIQVMIHELCVS